MTTEATDHKVGTDLELEKCPTGIKGLDEITGGGLPQGRPTLVCGSAGCGNPREQSMVEQEQNETPVSGKWELRLYVAGQTPKCVKAFANLRKLCEEHLPGQYRIEVIDLLENPQLAAGDQILAVPDAGAQAPGAGREKSSAICRTRSGCSSAWTCTTRSNLGAAENQHGRRQNDP